MAMRAVDHVRENAKKGEPVNLETLSCNFCMDNIAMLVYSIDVNAIGNPENEFTKFVFMVLLDHH